MNHSRVLAITKRTAELCGTQSLLHGAGFNLVAATSMNVARSVLQAVPVRGVIVCLDSWSSQERKRIVTELETNHPDVEVLIRCPGCTGCDEATPTLGTLYNPLPLTKLMKAITSSAKA